MPASAAELIALLDLEDLDVDLYRGRQPATDRQRVFGGQVAAQALIAATRSTDPAYVVHSLHSYFLLPGDTSVPIIYEVERIRDGRSFHTRRVVARQRGRSIYYLTANFHLTEDGFEHQDRMPEVIPPGGAPSLLTLMGEATGADPAELEKEWAALDLRYVADSRNGIDDPDHPARVRMWIRVNGELGEDPRAHEAAFAYASDMTLLGAALVPHGVLLTSDNLMPASLDHTIWFHRPFRADRWWLYDQWSPSAHGARGMALARVFTEEGVLAATVAQEGLIRRRRRRGSAE
jgi:acyl-CoA thioesterase II